MIFLVVYYTKYNKTHWQINEYETYARIFPEDIINDFYCIWHLRPDDLLRTITFFLSCDAQCYDKLYCDLYLVTTEQ